MAAHCVHCEALIPDNAKVCVYCGAEQPRVNTGAPKHFAPAEVRVRYVSRRDVMASKVRKGILAVAGASAAATAGMLILTAH